MDIDRDGISISNFMVLPPDPYGFDPDEDGLGCEISQAQVDTRGMPLCPARYHRSPDGHCGIHWMINEERFVQKQLEMSESSLDSIPPITVMRLTTRIGLAL